MASVYVLVVPVHVLSMTLIHVVDVARRTLCLCCFKMASLHVLDIALKWRLWTFESCSKMASVDVWNI